VAGLIFDAKRPGVDLAVRRAIAGVKDMGLTLSSLIGADRIVPDIVAELAVAELGAGLTVPVIERSVQLLPTDGMPTDTHVDVTGVAGTEVTAR
jgi:hypothetical protein